MATALVVGRVALAAVFATAAVAKFGDLAGSRRAVREFGVPVGLATVIGAALPIAELAVAASLVADPTAAAGAVAAICLLSAFSVAIAWNLARGRAPDCHCFGGLHSSRTSWRTIARNAMFIAVAVAIAADLGAAAPAVVAAGTAALLTLPAAIVARGRGEATPADQGLATGLRAPDFALPARDGGRVTLASLLAPRLPVLLVFSDPGCGPCQLLAPDLARWQRAHADEVTIAVIEARDDDADGAADPHGRANVLFDEGEIAAAYDAHGTPSAVLVSAKGEIAAPPAGGADAIEELLAGRVTGLARRRRRTGALDLCVELVRRELLIRGAGAMAAAGALFSRPLAAFAGGGGRGCGNRCGPQQTCVNTRCECRKRRKPDKCGKECTDFRTDPNNCGGCYRVPPMENPRGRRRGTADHACESGGACVGGQCRSGDGTICDRADSNTVCCNGDEADLNFQIDNCGACGNVCPDARGVACCYGDCVDTFTDANNCGRCGRRCPAGERCRDGSCAPCPDDQKVCRGPRGSGCYDPDRQGCCGGTVFSRRGDRECCAYAGYAVYDPDEYMCCIDGLVETSPDQFFCP